MKRKEALQARASWAQAKADIFKRNAERWTAGGYMDIAREAMEKYADCIRERDTWTREAEKREG